MSEDVLYEGDRACDRKAAAAYLRKLADRVAAGEQVLPAERGQPLRAPEDVAVKLRATDGDVVRVEVDLEWSPPAPDASDRTESPDNTREERNTDDDPRQATGWASAGASDGYPLPRVESLDEADDEFERAAYFLRKGKRDAAVSRFTSAVESTPKDARRRYQVATVCWQLGRTETAASHFRAAADLAPEDVTVQLDYASFLWSQGRIDAARERYDHAQDIAPEDPDVHSALGRFRWETEADIESAVDHLKRALSLDDDHGLAHCNYAVLLRHGGKHDRAEGHYQRALDLRGGDPIVQTEYGHFLWEQGEIEEAAKHYARAE